MHTQRDPFAGDGGALEVFDDGAVAFAGGRILATGDFPQVGGAYPDATVVDARDALLLPGLVDTHVHYPQLGIIGALMLGLDDDVGDLTPARVRSYC
jgi:guanine deaminase